MTNKRRENRCHGSYHDPTECLTYSISWQESQIRGRPSLYHSLSQVSDGTSPLLLPSRSEGAVGSVGEEGRVSTLNSSLPPPSSFVRVKFVSTFDTSDPRWRTNPPRPGGHR